MSRNRNPLGVSRRSLLQSGVALGGALATGAPSTRAIAATPLLKVDTRIIEVHGKAAKIYSIVDAAGRPGIFANAGDRFAGALLNASQDPLQMHWHGQVSAPFDQDRARPDGGALASGQTDIHDFQLTSGTHWMHSHTLSEQQLLAAPMVAREKEAGDVQDVVVMLHDFAFRSPQEILAELSGSEAQAAHGAGHGAAPAPTAHGAHDAGHMHHGHGTMSATPAPTPGHGAGHTMGMAHANDVRYDAFLANDRTLADPETVRIEKGGRVRLRIINGGTATAFFITTPGLTSTVVAVDGTSCQPHQAASYPLGQGQRLDLLVEIPTQGGAFPILAQVEDAEFLTGIILATSGASISKQPAIAAVKAGLVGVGLEDQLRASTPLADRRPDRSFHLMLGEQPGYRWTLNGRIHGEHEPLQVKQGERVEIMFMNPTSMMHPMHLHGHHFQVVDIGGRRFSGAMRDTVVVPANVPVTVAFDAHHKGSWFLHCHHLYHMATGMMTEVTVS